MLIHQRMKVLGNDHVCEVLTGGSSNVVPGHCISTSLIKRY